MQCCDQSDLAVLDARLQPLKVTRNPGVPDPGPTEPDLAPVIAIEEETAKIEPAIFRNGMVASNARIDLQEECLAAVAIHQILRATNSRITILGHQCLRVA